MFTAELKINGAMIGILYGHRTEKVGDNHGYVYEYSYWEPRSEKLITGEIEHKYEDGLDALVAKTLGQTNIKRRIAEEDKGLPVK